VRAYECRGIRKRTTPDNARVIAVETPRNFAVPLLLVIVVALATFGTEQFCDNIYKEPKEKFDHDNA